jgi:hypothetical protein
LYVFFLLILVSSLPGDPQALDCDSCMRTTQVGIVVTKTLIFHAYYSVQSKLLGHAPTTIPPTQCSLIIVSISALTITYHPQEQWLDLRRFTSSGELISQTQVYNPQRPVYIYIF